MTTAQDTLAENESIDTAYPHSIKVVRVEHDDREPTYRFEAPTVVRKSQDVSLEWENPHKARMFAAVYVAVGGFRVEKCGRRGIPPEVVRDGREAVVAYQSCLPGHSVDWLTNFWGFDRQRVYGCRSRIRARAESVQESSE